MVVESIASMIAGPSMAVPGVSPSRQCTSVRVKPVAGNQTSRARTRALAELFQTAGVKMTVSGSLLEARWRKLVWNVPFNGLAVTGGGITTEDILRSPAMEAEVWALMREVQAAAAAYGVAIPEEFVIDQVERTRPMGPYKPSTMLDYVAGKPLEVEPIWGEPLRRARAKSVPAPRLEALYARLKMLSPRP